LDEVVDSGAPRVDHDVKPDVTLYAKPADNGGAQLSVKTNGNC
jgi:hypothetical protein